MKQVALQRVSKIPPSPEGFEPVSVGVSLKGEALFLYIEKSSRACIGRRGESPSPKLPLDADGHTILTFKLLMLDGESLKEIKLPPLNFAFPRVDLLSDGSLVIVNARAHWKSKHEHDLNGLIHDPASGRQIRFYAGDAVQGVGIDGKDRIWISYFEEGINQVALRRRADGSLGIREGSGLIAREGLNCFDRNGKLIWQHDQHERYIYDCTALNVTADATHFVFSSDFDIGTVTSNFATGYRKAGLNECCGLAVSSDRALLVRGFRGSVRSVYFTNLDSTSAFGLKKCQLVRPNGQALKTGHAVGRGSTLHLFTKKEWYRVALEDL